MDGPATLIPKIFHRIWMGAEDGDPIPERFEDYWRRFQDLHPDWEFLTWSRSEDIEWIRCRSTYNQCKTHAGRADVLRYELMYKFGGVYVDTDVEPLRPFDPLLEDPWPFAAWENERLICPTVLGSPPGHPAFGEFLEFLPGWARRMPGVKPNYQTGPVPFTRFWRHRTDVRLFPREAFYPVGWWERDKLGGPYPADSYSVHHWVMGWKPDEKGRVR